MAFLHDNMHPAWSADACTLAFDSTHTGQGWQVCCSEYIIIHLVVIVTFAVTVTVIVTVIVTIKGIFGMIMKNIC